MKERYDDDKFYSEDQQFGPITIRNYGEVLRNWNYARYEQRFRALAERDALQQNQRPKLNEEEFASARNRLLNCIWQRGGADIFNNEESARVVHRLLLTDDLEEDEDCR